MKLLFGAVLMAVVLGCGPKVWVQPGATMDDFRADRLYCQTSANQWAGGGDVAGQIMASTTFHDCMVANGWVLEAKQ